MPQTTKGTPHFITVISTITQSWRHISLRKVLTPTRRTYFDLVSRTALAQPKQRSPREHITALRHHGHTTLAPLLNPSRLQVYGKRDLIVQGMFTTITGAPKPVVGMHQPKAFGIKRVPTTTCITMQQASGKLKDALGPY